MLNLDDKYSCLDVTKKAYQALQFYEEMKHAGKENTDLVQSAFGIVEHMIVDLASIWGISSTLHDAHMNRINESKNRNLRIEELEKKISEMSDYSNFEENLNTIAKRTNQIWNEQGFANYQDMDFGNYETIVVTLSLKPAKYTWDIDLSNGDNKDAIPNFITNAFTSQRFDIQNSDERNVCLYDNDKNRDKISNLVKALFPGSRITQWKTNPSNDSFVMDGVKVLLSNLSYVREDKK